MKLNTFYLHFYSKKIIFFVSDELSIKLLNSSIIQVYEANLLKVTQVFFFFL